MGLFDYLNCEIDLPGTTKGEEFQTKDLECFMEYYTIRADGTLIQHYRELETTPKAERPYPDAKDGLLAIRGMLRAKPGSERDIRVAYDGDLEFYGTGGDFRATYRKGTLQEICRLVNGEWEPCWRIAEAQALLKQTDPKEVA